MENKAEHHTSADDAVESRDAKYRGRFMPLPLRLIALAIIVAGGVWWLIDRSNSPPAIEAQRADEAGDYRLVTGRVTPPDAAELSDEFVAVKGRLREQVLQQLAEFRARWKIPGPRVEVNAYDTSGDAVAAAKQLEGWLEQYDLLSSAPSSAGNDGRRGSGSDGTAAQAGIDRATLSALPAPPSGGLTIRARDADTAIARDLALALAPVVGGEVNLLIDERIPASRLVVDLVGAPRFGSDGVAYFNTR